MGKILTLLFSGILVNVSAQNIESAYTEDWVSGEWQTGRRIMNTYDAQCRNTSSAKSNYDTSGMWINQIRFNFEYGSNGKRSSYVSQSGAGDSFTWINNNKLIYNYTSFDSASVVVALDWNGMAWDTTGLWTTQYNSSHAPVQRLLQARDSATNSWQNTGLELYATNADGQIDTLTILNWNDVQNDWSNEWRNVYSYTAEGWVQSRVEEIWSNVVNAWKPMYKVDYAYTTSGKLYSLFQSYWDGALWFNHHNEYLTYDAYENELMHLCMDWNNAVASWQNSNLMTRALDSNGNAASMLDQVWDTTSNVWINQYRIWYTYSCLGTGIPVVQSKGTINVFPNPSNGSISVAFEEVQRSGLIEVTNVLGQSVVTKTLDTGSTSADFYLNPGIYLLTLKKDNQRATEKVVVAR